MADKNTKDNIEKKLNATVKKLPTTPGVYKFIDDGRVLYIGKAKNLKNRVQTYFRKDDKRPVRLKKLLEKIDDLQYIEVDSELEAFILETNLIKELKPKYNVLMKDDKGYVYIKITRDEDFPRVEVVRKMQKDNALYFGPKTSAKAARDTIDLLHKLFKFRNCRLGIAATDEVKEDGDLKVEITNKVINYPCLEYHIKRCDAPCIGKISVEDYKKSIDEVIAFLQGNTKKVLEDLKERMMIASQNKNFEYAAKLRDKYMAVEAIQEKQKISEATHENRDVVSFVIRADKAFFNVFVVRDGKLINQENFIVDTKLQGLVDPEDYDLRAEIFERFVKDYYEHTHDYPSEILTSESELDIGFLEQWVQMHAERKVRVVIPKKGKKSHILELSLKNAESFAKQSQIKWDTEEARTIGASKELAAALGLEKELKRIECFDISHLSGTETVASMVVFENGVPKKSDYRHFMIRTLDNGKIDDFKSMEEVVARRLKYLKNDDFFVKWKGFKVRKVKKAELSILSEFKERGGWNPAEDVKGYFFLQNPQKEVIGICCVQKKDDVFHLKNVYVDDEYRGLDLGRFMIAKALEMVDAQKVYIVTGLELLEYYEGFGFKALKSTDVPEQLSESVVVVEKKYSGVAVMLFDKEAMYSKYAQPKIKQLKIDDKLPQRFAAEVMGRVVCLVEVTQLDKKGAYFSHIDCKDGYGSLLFDVLKKAYKETEVPKFYAVRSKDGAELFLKNGYEEIKTAPEPVKEAAAQVEDSVILAYYRKKQQKADASFGAHPDLIVIDGGKGQLSSAMKSVEASGVEVSICSLAKKKEDVYLPGNSSPISLNKESQGQYLVQRIRDEAHRFAISHNRKRRDKNMLA